MRSSRRTTRAAPSRFAHDGATQNYVELEGGGKAAFGALVAGRSSTRRTGGTCGIFKPGDVSEVTIRFRPDGAPNGFARRVPETYVRDAADQGAFGRRGARRSPRSARAPDWKLDLAPYRAARAVAADAAHRPRRPRVRLPARRNAGRGAHPAAARRSPATSSSRSRRTCTCPNRSSAASANCAARTTRSPASPASSAGLLYGLGGCILGVLWLARQHWLAVAAGARRGLRRRRTDGGDEPVRGARPRGSTSTPRNRRRRSGCGRSAPRRLVALGGGLAYALVFMAAESLARRAFPHHPQLWRRLVARRRRDARGARAHRSAATCFVPLELALVAAFLLRDEPLARLVAAVRGADRSQHPRRPRCRR